VPPGASPARRSPAHRGRAAGCGQRVDRAADLLPVASCHQEADVAAAVRRVERVARKRGQRAQRGRPRRGEAEPSAEQSRPEPERDGERCGSRAHEGLGARCPCREERAKPVAAGHRDVERGEDGMVEVRRRDAGLMLPHDRRRRAVRPVGRCGSALADRDAASAAARESAGRVTHATEW
jgi:hypothetical protein